MCCSPECSEAIKIQQLPCRAQEPAKSIPAHELVSMNVLRVTSIHEHDVSSDAHEVSVSLVFFTRSGECI